jgi:hypothetical protein
MTQEQFEIYRKKTRSFTKLADKIGECNQFLQTLKVPFVEVKLVAYTTQGNVQCSVSLSEEDMIAVETIVMKKALLAHDEQVIL